MPRPWLRLYRDILHKPKIQKLKPELFRAWVNILCCTEDNGGIPEIDELAFLLHVNTAKATEYLSALVKAGLVDKSTEGFFAHDWDAHQYNSDVSTGRVKRFRERFKCVSPGVSETPPDTDTDTDKIREERVEARLRASPTQGPPEPLPVSRPKETRRGTRWPPDAIVPDDWLDDGAEARAISNLPPLDLRAEALKFANYWASKSGGGATKMDWKRTWLNWCLTAKSGGNYGTNRKSQLEQLAEIASEAGDA